MFLEIKGIKKSFGAGESHVDVLKGIDLEIEKGEFCVLLGPSGSGKSTLLNIIGGIDGADAGSITIQGEQLEDMNEKKLSLYRRKHLGYIFQMYNLIPNLTVRENIEVGAYLSDRPLDVDELLETLGLYEHQRKLPNQLSGGQQQRTAIGRAIVKNPDILLCDEATSALDPQTTEAILKLLKKINREMGVTILLITHQMQVVQMICNKVAVMEKGQVVEAGSVLDVFGKPQAPVTKRFVQTVVNDQIPESIISLVKEQKEHFRVERLKFIGSSVKRPVISDICHVEGIVVNILGATVQELQDNIMCVFILQLLGSEEKILKAEKQIDENGVIRERVEVI